MQEIKIDSSCAENERGIKEKERRKTLMKKRGEERKLLKKRKGNRKRQRNDREKNVEMSIETKTKEMWVRKEWGEWLEGRMTREKKDKR